MEIKIETERLIIREVEASDAQGMFELDADPEVHTYLGNKPISRMEEAIEAIAYLQQQYAKLGIGRWAVIEKESGEFIGWTGFKFITFLLNGRTNYYDLGYRFIRRFWGKGYATETAIASLNYGFDELKQEEIFAMADIRNIASNTILQKIGMTPTNIADFEGVPHQFYQITQNDWKESNLGKKKK